MQQNNKQNKQFFSVVYGAGLNSHKLFGEAQRVLSHAHVHKLKRIAQVDGSNNEFYFALESTGNAYCVGQNFNGQVFCFLLCYILAWFETLQQCQ